MIDELQIEWEIETLVALARDANSILEVGVYQGGTLRRWLGLADHVVAIDHDLAPLDREQLALHDVTLIEGDTGADHVIAMAAELGPYDLVFIDADHGYQMVSQDFTNYWPMVADGGMLALHDLRREGVGQLWNGLLTSGHPTCELHHRLEDWGGIGVIWK